MSWRAWDEPIRATPRNGDVMSAFDIKGPSSIGQELEKSARNSRSTSRVSDKLREQRDSDPGTEIFNGESKIYRKKYNEMRMKK